MAEVRKHFSSFLERPNPLSPAYQREGLSVLLQVVTLMMVEFLMKVALLMMIVVLTLAAHRMMVLYISPLKSQRKMSIHSSQIINQLYMN